jgi:hypothetical protein
MKWMMVGLLLWGMGVEAQVPVIGQVVGTVVRAADLVVQRLQTETIVLQEAEQELQNAMSGLRLEEIANWVDDQRSIYAEYFQELGTVKTVVSGYFKVAAIVERQKEILAAYQQGLALFRQDKHFSAAELGQIEMVYGGILTESGKNLERLTMVLQSLVTQMTDEQRMAIVDGAAAGMDKNYRDLQVYTEQNELLSLQRARDEDDIAVIRKLYGL